MEPTSRTVVANGLRHRVLEWDGGGDDTVLCLHGFLDLAWAFHGVAPALAEAGHHVVAPDLRGHGETQRVGAGGYYHFLDYVLDVAELLPELSRGRLAVVGHSMGGGVAAYFAGAFPDAVRRVAILEGLQVPDTPPSALPARTADWVAGVRRARAHAPRVYASVDEAAARLRQVDPMCPPGEARFLAERSTRAVPGGVSFLHDPLHLTPAPYPFRLEHARAYWAAVRCPVLLLDGAEGGRAPAELAARAAAFCDGRHATVPGAGHMLMRHRPDAVAAALVAFLAR